MTITELSIKRPPLVIVVFAALAILGLFSYIQLKYEFLPDITPPYVSVLTVYPGAAPQEVEDSVTKPIEEAVAVIDKVKSITSGSYENYSVCTLEFAYTVKANDAIQEVQKKVNETLSSLPPSIETPAVSNYSLNDLPILRIGATADMDGGDLFEFVKTEAKPRLSRLDGVGQVAIVGGEEREIRINLDFGKLTARGIPLNKVLDALKSANADRPVGKIRDADGDYLLRLSGKYSSIEGLRKVIVDRGEEGAKSLLGDFADIEDGTKEATAICRIDGKNALGIEIRKQTGANAVEVSRAVRAELAAMEKEYADRRLSFDVAQDSSLFTLESAKSVTNDLFLAILLVALVMLAFLHSIRGSMIVLVSIPLSIIVTFVGVYAFGMSLNMMTLLALSLIIGILVDDSIVVLENIYRHMETGKSRKAAALVGRNEIGFAALSITMVDVVVFLPLSLISGMTGNIVRQYALVVVLATAVSLFVSFTMTPMLASRFAKVEGTARRGLPASFGRAFDAIFAKVVAMYARLLEGCLARRAAVVVASLALFAGSLALVGIGAVGSEIMPPMDRGQIQVALTAPARTSMLEMNEVTAAFERTIHAMPEVSGVFTTVGMASSSTGIGSDSSPNLAVIDVTLVPAGNRKRSSQEVSEEIKKLAKELPGMRVDTSPIGLFGTGDSFTLGMIVRGAEREKVQAAAERIEAATKGVEGAGEVKLSSGEAVPVIDLIVDHDRLSDLALSLDEVSAQLGLAFSGYDDLKLRSGGSERAMRVIADKAERSSTAKLGRMRFINAAGREVELAQFAEIESTYGPTVLQRADRLPSITVLSQAIGRPSGDIAADIRSRVGKLRLGEGIFVSEVGDAEAQGEAFTSLGLAILAAVVFVYLVMVALFNSFLDPFIVLFSIPTAAVGAIAALALAGKTLNIFSILGMIMLIGLVAKNAILLVDRANRNRAEGMETVPALVEAGRTRLRPIAMTTFAMIFGMTPIALAAGGGGAELRSSLGVVLIGGLASSLFLTLLLVPAVYSIVEGLKEKTAARIKARKAED
jgi:hydrophobic/amphiphilic exporter-1 (mainly G- bacteria), HAE1 family